jgi:hypothetical protein
VQINESVIIVCSYESFKCRVNPFISLNRVSGHKYVTVPMIYFSIVWYFLINFYVFGLFFKDEYTMFVIGPLFSGP